MIKKSTSQKKYNPILMALGNLLLLGAPYFFMNLYKRFFIAYGLMFFVTGSKSLTNIVSWGNIAADISTILTLVLFPFIIIDTYVQATKINKEKIQKPKWKRAPVILGLLTMLIFIATFFSVERFVYMTTPDPVFGKSQWERQQENKEREQRQEAIYTKYNPIQDERCNSFRKDPMLDFGRTQLNSIFTEYCYFKKAVEANDPLYCNQYHEQLGFNEECIAYFAIIKNEPELCDKMAKYKTLCHSDYEDQTNPMRKPCISLSIGTKGQMPDTVLGICKEFQEFHDSLPTQ